MKRWLVGILLAALAGVLLAIVIDSKRDPIAILERHGGKIERNEQGEVVGVDLRGASMSPTGQKLLHLIGLGEQRLSLSDAALVHLKGLTNLQTLNLHGTKITDAGLVHLKGLTKLQTLDLWDTKITDAGLVHLKGLTKLTWLNLPGTKITDAGLIHLQELPRLETLNLLYTKVTDAGIAELKQALPDCKIIK